MSTTWSRFPNFEQSEYSITSKYNTATVNFIIDYLKPTANSDTFIIKFLPENVYLRTNISLESMTASANYFTQEVWNVS
jgi:hypothetical protein